MLSSLIFLCQKRKNYNNDMIHHDSLGETFSNFKTKVQWILNCSMIFCILFLSHIHLSGTKLTFPYDMIILCSAEGSEIMCAAK